MTVNPLIEAMAVRIELLQQLVQLRHRANMSQKRMAESVGLRQSCLSEVERGERQPYMDTFIQFASALDMHVALVEAHHLPLLALSAAQVEALVMAATAYMDATSLPTPALRGAIATLSSILVDDEEEEFDGTDADLDNVLNGLSD